MRTTMSERSQSAQPDDLEQSNAMLMKGGSSFFFGSCIALGLTELILRKPLPELHPWGGAPLWIVQLSGASLAGFGLAGLVPSWRKTASLALACHWLVAFLSTLIAAAGDIRDPLIWVPVSKTALFALAAILIGSRQAAVATALRITFGATLIFYGLVHLFERALISELIPAWIPKAVPWPLITGSLMIGAGLALCSGRIVRSATFAIAALFSSWILLLHIENIAANPSSSFQWTFALSASALVGVALLIGSGEPTSRTSAHSTDASVTA